jgi:hypothetical protein
VSVSRAFCEERAENLCARRPPGGLIVRHPPNGVSSGYHRTIVTRLRDRYRVGPVPVLIPRYKARSRRTGRWAPIG